MRLIGSLSMVETVRRVLVRVGAAPGLAGAVTVVASTAALVLGGVVAGLTGVVVVLSLLLVVSLTAVVVSGPLLVRIFLQRIGAPGLDGRGGHEGARLDLLFEEQERLAARLNRMDRQITLLRDQQAATLVERARQARESGDDLAAIRHYEDALVLTPADPALQRAHGELVDGVEAAERGTRGLARAVDRQLAAGHHAHAQTLLRRGLDRIPHSLRLRDRHVALLAHAGDHEEALAVARETAELRTAQWEDRRPAAHEARHLEAYQRIAISGFFYSGSGAAKDHLRGYRDVVSWPPKGELRIVKFPGGYVDLGRRLTAAGQLNAADLVDHYLHLVGRKLTGVAPGVYDTWEVVNANSRRMLREPARTAGYLAACMAGFLELVDRAEGGELQLEDVQALSRTTLQRALDAAATDNRAGWLLIDQVVTGWRLDQAVYLPPVSFVLVHRDPRDRFAEVRAVLEQPGRRTANRDPAAFARQARRHLAEAEQRVGWLESLGHRVLRLAFEDLVLEPQRTIPAIDDYLGLTGAEVEEQRFYPERSRRNVGKHVALVPPEELAVIEREAADLLDPRAVPAPDTG
ncbi:MAG: hypothetical protein EA340_14400 [Nitriliruptor sp.]|nr:MAG: hypothetical protein EA340_14400 [Nitriliruptor sp.]